MTAGDKALRLFAVVPLLLGVAACGGDAEAKKVMPAVAGRQLDVALSDIKRAGFDDEVEIVGGGTFGIRNKSNWTVCEQLPEAGKEIDSKPRLTVDRSCADGAAKDEAKEEDSAKDEPTTEPTTTTTEAPTTTSTEAPKPPEEVLTAANSRDFAALLALRDPCSNTVGPFASNYRNRTIEFDGNAATMGNHEGRNTRYDILIGAGNFSETSSRGPNFQFRDVNMFDLHLPPDSRGVRTGDNLHIVAKVGEYSEQMGCLFRIYPVSTQIR